MTDQRASVNRDVHGPIGDWRATSFGLDGHGLNSTQGAAVNIDHFTIAPVDEALDNPNLSGRSEMTVALAAADGF